MTKTVALILTILLIAGVFFGSRFTMRLVGRAIERNERRNKHPRKWTAVQGTINSSKMDSVTHVGPDLVEGGSTSFMTLRFSYQVEGVRYSGKQTFMSGHALQKCHPLALPEPVTVYYNPANPKKSVIDPLVFSFRGRLVALVLSATFLLVIPAVAGAVIWSIITIWTLAEDQPW